MKIHWALAAIAWGAVVLSASGAIGAAKYHKASTDAEKALEHVLKIADNDDEVLDNLFHRYPVKPKLRVDYTGLLTPTYMAALKEEQRKVVQSDCGGKYLDGEVCGMDYNPLTCAQDTAAPFRLATVRTRKDKTDIVDSHADKYTMAHAGSGWKLDGVTCSGN
jgi:hypothetical protein